MLCSCVVLYYYLAAYIIQRMHACPVAKELKGKYIFYTIGTLIIDPSYQRACSVVQWTLVNLIWTLNGIVIAILECLLLSECHSDCYIRVYLNQCYYNNYLYGVLLI